jgi:hypothetical protein
VRPSVLGTVTCPSALRSQRSIIRATVAASLLSGAPSLGHALAQRGIGGAWRYGVDATRAIGVLVPPGRRNFAAGALAHFAISIGAGQLLGRVLPRRRSVLWGAGAGALMGVVGAGIVGRRFPAIRALPFGPQLADNVAFGVVFALVADLPEAGT